LASQLPRYILKYHLVPICYILFRVYLSLLRIKVVGEKEALKQLARYGRVVVALWHQRLLPSLAYAAKFRNMKLTVMISRSRDGELIARIARHLGIVPVRGSSSRGGREAFVEILEGLKENPAVVHIVDGPRGPKGVIKPGLIRIAQMSGAVILPIIVSADRAWIMRSWDRFLVPKPFSEVTIRWGKPFFVSQDMDRVQLETVRKEIEDTMITAYAETDLKSGWTTPL